MELTLFWQIIWLLTFMMAGYLVYRTVKSERRDTNKAVFVDTSVLIDARIVSIAKTGFVPGKLIIPRSVIGELQFMADNADNDKRAKARRGLDVIKELQDIELISVEILQDGSHAREGVDERLLKLAKERGGYLCTIDYNLNKVAQVEGIPVLNVNELAQQIRMVYLPGDTLKLALTQKGQDSHQAVGHLDDGTMVVVENSSSHIGQTLEVSVIRSLQTSAGRMIFAKRIGATADQAGKKQKTPMKQTKQKTAGRMVRPDSAYQSDTEKPQREHVAKNQGTQKKPSVSVPRSKDTPTNNTRQQSGRHTVRRRATPEDTLVRLANQPEDAHN